MPSREHSCTRCRSVTRGSFPVIPGANPGSSSPSFRLHIRIDLERGVISAGHAGNSRLNNLARGDCARVGSPSAPTERRCDFRAALWSPGSLSPSRPVPARVSGARRRGSNGARLGCFSSVRWVLTGNDRQVWRRWRVRPPRSARWTALADEWGEGARTLAGGAEVILSRAAEEPTDRTMVGFRCSSSTACAGNPRGRFPE